MGKAYVTFWWLLVTTCLSNIRCAPTYTVISPDTIRPDRDYSVAISLFDVPGTVEVTLTISGLSERRGYHSVTKTDVITSQETHILKLETGDWGPGQYNLTVTGRGAFNFYNETSLKYEHKSYSVMIQTDRAIYKPGSQVHFRALVINPRLQPVPSLRVTVTIKDGNGNVIEQWPYTTPATGVLSGQFDLSEEPVLGDWMVHVDIQGQEFNKTFVVAEYILPTYHVQIDLPAYVTYEKSDVEATIKALYHYGKPVQGEITVTVAPLVRYNYLSVRPLEVYQVKTKIDGSAKISVNLLNDLQLKTDFFKREIEFFVLVEEEGTGRKYNSTNTMWIYDKEINIELIKTAVNFKPGLTYVAYLRVAYQDNKPISGPLRLKYGYGGTEEQWNTTEYLVPSNGILKMEFHPPLSKEVRALAMKAEFRGQTFYLDKVEPAFSPSTNFLQVRLLTERPRVDQNVNLEVNGTEPFDHLAFKVMSRGDIILSQVVPVAMQSIFQISFRVTQNMPPNVRVVVYYVRRANNEIVADSINFNSEGAFRTPTSIATNVKSGQPGQSMVIRVDTRPYSFVGILATDSESAAIKSGNDITEKQVLQDLQTFDGGQHTSKHWPPQHHHRTKRAIWAPGAASASETFEDSGVLVLTNGLVYRTPASKFGEDAIYLDERVLLDPVLPTTDLPDGPELYHKIILRKDLPNTWLWVNTTTGDDGTAVFSVNLPDSLTNYTISAFSISPSTGLGIASTSAQVSTYRPFFVTLSIPQSVFRGESVAIQAVVFNNNNKPLQAEVSIDNRKGEYEFTTAGEERGIEGKPQERRSRIITVPPQESMPVSVLITPLQYGPIDIRVTATSSIAADTVTKKLVVKYEGTPQYFNRAMMVDFRNAPSSKFNVTAPPLSQRVTVSGSGDLMGFVVTNRKNLLRLPDGGGEHTLLNLVANVIVLEYMGRTNQLTPEVRKSCIADLKTDYQRQLLYRRDDGSFSMFGNKDKSGSTWLTAYALKTLYQVQQYITVDKNVTTFALTWLMEQRVGDGSFGEPGELHHRVLQRDSDDRNVALTAFVISCLAEANIHSLYPREVLSSEQFLARELFSTADNYVISLITYALHLLESSNRESAFQKLVNSAKSDGDLMSWKAVERPQVNTTDKQSDYFYLPNAMDIETTSYALLTFATRREFSTIAPILRWLLSQQNELGGFTSSQDTAVAIKALSESVALLGRTATSFDIKYNVDGEGTQSLRVSSLAPQKVNLLPKSQNVEVEGSGQGLGIMQVSWEYNLAVSGETPPFYLNALLDKTSTESYLQLSICTYSLQSNFSSNLAVMEVELPSGYLADVDALPSILQIPKVKRVVAYQGDSVVVIYFDKLDGEESCVTVPAHRTHKVSQQKRVPVKVYDYYNLATSARMFYYPHQSTLCDICEDDDCGKGCEKYGKQELQSTNEPLSASMPTVLTTSLSMFILSFIMLQLV